MGSSQARYTVDCTFLRAFATATPLFGHFICVVMSLLYLLGFDICWNPLAYYSVAEECFPYIHRLNLICVTEEMVIWN